jgi:hypothetical protein
MRTETVFYQDDELNVQVTVRRATFLDDLVRSEMLTGLFSVDEKKAKTEDGADAAPAPISAREQAMRTAEIVIWPCVLTTTESVQGLAWPMTMDEFVNLPLGLVDAWVEAVWKQNPDWSPHKETGTGQAEKKA